MLSTELQTVPDWFTLGLKFLMEKYELDAIRLSFSTEGVKRCRIEMIDQYLKSGQASWKGVVSALREIGEHALANRLEGKYIKPREGKSCDQRLNKITLCDINPRLCTMYVDAVGYM